MTDATAVEVRRDTLTTVEYHLTNAPDIPRKYARQTMRPTMLRVRYRNGKLNALTFVGRIVRADGSTGSAGYDDTYYPGEEPEALALAWAWALVPQEEVTP